MGSNKQTKFTSDEYVFNDMKGLMPSLYKAAVAQYKADIAAGRIKAHVFVERAPEEERPLTLEDTYHTRKETEQSRLI